MIQEYKKILIKDLCNRLPYSIKCDINDNKPYTLCSISNDYNDFLVRFKEQENGFNIEVYISEVKLYLFPLSTMTKEQKEEYYNLCSIGTDECGDIIYFDTYQSIDYLNKNKFDYRGLIPMGLAIDATNLNIY